MKGSKGLVYRTKNKSAGDGDQNRSSDNTPSSSVVTFLPPSQGSHKRQSHSPLFELAPLSSRSQLALRNLTQFGTRQHRRQAEHGIGWSDWPMDRRAAVMVALFGGKDGELDVLLTTRAAGLRVNVSASWRQWVMTMKADGARTARRSRATW